ncbi:hypothetical protein CJD36_006335 [Flavipsychrobacter stenotrophus]|uniref:Uncharacterized protein n=1 Tax=Flavipsychrobacter stenotrophus TaxID=2077091 RepID=A0A2S7SXT3_9BACT|nr:hypothetical protein [Flavipsychrobacter stenotrophus]PQJ11417.1 hypothetical protein CJD36_006335 [Flavipsychrobacter stenotrophus]
MTTENNLVDYGIYMDHKNAFIISLPHGVQEALLEEDTEQFKASDIEGSTDQSRQLHVQNRENEFLKKFCKAIMGKIEHPNNILIFGPSSSKFELQKEIQENKSLKNTSEEIKVTDTLSKEEATRFVGEHYNRSASI